MRHRRRGRKLGRNPNHQRALLRNLASSLILTERDDPDEDNAPRVKGRVVTTLHKAKEVRPLVEKCVTIARRSLPAQEAARQFATASERNSGTWRTWRQSDQWQQWNQAIAPVVAARRHVLRLLGSQEAVQILFSEIAPRFADRNGGYTRIVRLAHPRLGDAGVQAILEFVGIRDRVIQRSERPAFDKADDEETAAADGVEVDSQTDDETATAESIADGAPRDTEADAGADDQQQ
jgi:large subunit ribosomal protein L17